MSRKNSEETKSGLDKRKLKVALVVAVIVVPGIALGAFATGIIGNDSGETGDGTGTEPSSASDESGGEGNLVIDEIVEDPPGEANEEEVVFQNTGDGSIDMSGWTVSDEADQTYTFPDGFTLGSGDSVTLHTQSGTSSETDLYWGSGRAIWNNAGDTVTVRNAEGDVVLEESY